MEVGGFDLMDLKEVLWTEPKFHLNTTSGSEIIQKQLFQGAVYTTLYTQKVNYV